MVREERYDLFFSMLSKVLVWGGLFCVVYLLRSFSLLMFLVFVFSYIQSNVVNKLEPWINSRRIRVTLVGSLFLAWLILVGAFLIPQFRAQAVSFATNFSIYAQTLDREVVKLTEQYPFIAEFVPVAPAQDLSKGEWDIRHSTLARVLQPLLGLGEKSDNGEAVKSTLSTVGNIGSTLLGISSQFLLSLLFSFLIVYDLPNLKKGVMSLQHTKLGYVYDEVGDSLVAFGRTLGRAFEAQILIAVTNTVLTAIGILMMGIRGELAFVSLIVFFCSFVPIAGVFISSVPICLLALEQGGVPKAVGAVLLIAFVHVVESYILNPRIVGHHLRLNTVVVLILITVSGKIFGIWGLVLCLPVATYIFQHAIKHKDRPQEENPAQSREKRLEHEIEGGLRLAAVSIAQARFGADSQPLLELLNGKCSESNLLPFIDSAARGSGLDDLLSQLSQDCNPDAIGFE
jgi:predicted PurR-regulated permease PerM